MRRPKDNAKQLSLFGPADPPVEKRAPAVQPAAIDDDLRDVAARLPKEVHLGTSSWSFPGWRGIVYASEHTEADLARGGLAAYAQHPILRAVGVDKTYYRPLATAEFRNMADAVPPGFRFLVKAASQVCAATIRTSSGAAAANTDFLNADWAASQCVRPYAEGLGEKAGVLVFQFSRMSLRPLGGAEGALRRLAAFLAALPPGPTYGVEIRNPELWGPAYFEMLDGAGATHCYNVHPQMPTIAEQVRDLPPGSHRGPIVVRWMLERSQTYEGARDAYAPFDRLVDEDPESRNIIAQIARTGVKIGRDMIVVANNKAEGSAPLTLIKLARAIVEHEPPRAA